jgi:AcrR family transcriptional regulator
VSTQDEEHAVAVVGLDANAERPPGYPPRRNVPPAAAKVRILATADRLFYDEGIRSVGIDRLIGESKVTKATFYKHYGSKDRLIVEYVLGRDRAARSVVEELVERTDSPRAVLDGVIATIVGDTQSPSFRGCPFINASAEFGEPGHPVRRAVSDHRDWLTETFAGLLGAIGHPLPGDAADDLMLARDGALTGSYAGDPVATSAAFQRAAHRIMA